MSTKEMEEIQLLSVVALEMCGIKIKSLTHCEFATFVTIAKAISDASNKPVEQCIAEFAKTIATDEETLNDLKEISKVAENDLETFCTGLATFVEVQSKKTA